jgi:hypothetical protein
MRLVWIILVFWFRERVFLGAKSTSILDCVGWLVRWSVRPPRCAITWKTRVRDCFEKRRRKRKLIMSQFHYVAIPSHLGIRRSPCFYLNCIPGIPWTGAWVTYSFQISHHILLPISLPISFTISLPISFSKQSRHKAETKPTQSQNKTDTNQKKGKTKRGEGVEGEEGVEGRES